jgi:hypothetical protein
MYDRQSSSLCFFGRESREGHAKPERRVHCDLWGSCIGLDTRRYVRLRMLAIDSALHCLPYKLVRMLVGLNLQQGKTFVAFKYWVLTNMI